MVMFCEQPIIDKRHRITPVLSGLSAAVTVFNEEEIVAGDFVKVDLDPEVFKMMNEARNMWDDSLTKVIINLNIIYNYCV